MESPSFSMTSRMSSVLRVSSPWTDRTVSGLFPVNFHFPFSVTEHANVNVKVCFTSGDLFSKSVLCVWLENESQGWKFRRMYSFFTVETETSEKVFTFLLWGLEGHNISSDANASSQQNNQTVCELFAPVPVWLSAATCSAEGRILAAGSETRRRTEDRREDRSHVHLLFLCRTTSF